MTEVRPPQISGLTPSFGFGDRLGLATPGHLDAIRVRGEGIFPIFAQQSMREMQRTGRKPSDVLQETITALQASNYSGAWGADADHLKTPEDVNATAGAGFVFFTIDPVDYVDHQAHGYSESELKQRFYELRDDVHWANDYIGRKAKIDSGHPIEFDALTVMRIAVKYGKAIAHAAKMGAHVDRMMTKRMAPFEIELCVDETPEPSTPAEHFILAEQCLNSNMKLASIALRYEGSFESGVDFRGDVKALARSVERHAAIAEKLGPYKLGLHAGSDKFSIYAAFARATRGRFHIKTAGTSYLEALRVAARHEGKLFRRIIEVARKQYATDRATYRVSANIERVPLPAAINDMARLEKIYLDEPDGRQILHVTFGSILADSGLGPSLRDVLVAHPETHREVLTAHFAKHLKELKKGM